jgi:hypothetical protein
MILQNVSVLLTAYSISTHNTEIFMGTAVRNSNLTWCTQILFVGVISFINLVHTLY